MKKYVTIVGSRDITEDVEKRIYDIAYKFAELGYILRSGAAPGCDQVAEKAFKDYFAKQDVDPTRYLEIFLPWEKFENNTSQLFEAPDEAYKMAEEIHPAWDKLTQGAKRLHARNCGQVLGRNLSTPSELLVCWAEPQSDGSVKGGTRTAVELAKKNGVPVFNIAVDNVKFENNKLIKVPIFKPTTHTVEISSEEEIPF